MKWYLGTIGLLLVALAFDLGLMAYAMYALLGVMLVSRFLARTWAGSLDAQRECNRYSANVGDLVAVILNVKNRGGLPVAWVLLEDLLPVEATAVLPEGRITYADALDSPETEVICLLSTTIPRWL